MILLLNFMVFLESGSAHFKNTILDKRPAQNSSVHLLIAKPAV